MCIEAKVYGIICFGMGLTLREGNREYFYKQLDLLFPRLKEKYIQTYKNQYIIESPNTKDLMGLFCQKCSKNGIIHNNKQIFQYLNTFEKKLCYTTGSLEPVLMHQTFKQMYQVLFHFLKDTILITRNYNIKRPIQIHTYNIF